MHWTNCSMHHNVQDLQQLLDTIVDEYDTYTSIRPTTALPSEPIKKKTASSVTIA